MMIYATNLLLSALLATGTAATTPDTLDLDLNGAIALAIDQSHSAKVLDLDLSGAEHDVEAAKGRFRTRADVYLALPELEEGVQRVQVPGDLPRYDNYGSRQVSATLQVSQPLPTDGTIRLSTQVYHQDDSYFDYDLDETQEQQNFFNSYEISLDQPLFTPNELKLGLERAEINHRLSRRAYHRGQLDLAYEVTVAFFSLLRAQEELVIAREAAARQGENWELAERKFKAGLIPEVDALQMEVDLAAAENDVLTRESDAILAADRFRLLLGVPMTIPVEVHADISPQDFLVDHTLAHHHAQEYRTEIFDLQDRLRNSEITVIETDARDDFKGELSAFYNLTGISDPTLVDPSFGDQMQSTWEDLKRRPGNRGVRFTLSIPIWDSGVNEQEVASARVNVRRRELDQENLSRDISRQVQAALSEFEAAKRRLDVLGRSREIALRSYEISLQRFDTGDITSQDLANNRDRLIQARRSYLSAFVNYRLASADLRRQTLYDFERGQSLVVGNVEMHDMEPAQ